MCLNKIKNLSTKIDYGSFEIAVWNSVGSILAVGIPTFIDPQLEHHVRYGARIYPLGEWVLLISLLVFALTLILNINKNFSTKKKAILTFCAILLPTWATLPVFKPEFPHMNVFGYPIYFGLISAGVVLLRGSKVDFSFLKSNISYETKLERLKIEYNYWFKLAAASIATYGLFAISIAVEMSKIVEMATKEPSEIFLLNVTGAFALILNAIWFLTGYLREILTKISDIKNNFSQLE